MKILDLGATFGYPCANIFNPWKPKVTEWDKSKGMEQLEGIDLVIYGGGQDVCPAMYGHKNVSSQCPDEPGQRDRLESEIFDATIGRGIYNLGICRGAQFLCVKTGGWLVQHVHNHAGRDHTVVLRRDKQIGAMVMNSYHHQMMVLAPHHDMLGYTKGLSEEYIYDVIGAGFKEDVNLNINPEIVLFNDFNMGFQCHPEYLDPSHTVPAKVREYVEHFFRKFK